MAAVEALSGEAREFSLHRSGGRRAGHNVLAEVPVYLFLVLMALIMAVPVLWMVVEAAVSLGAGVLARSALLTAFGIDSVIELVSGAILLWRLSVEAAL